VTKSHVKMQFTVYRVNQGARLTFIFVINGAVAGRTSGVSSSTCTVSVHAFQHSFAATTSKAYCLQKVRNFHAIFCVCEILEMARDICHLYTSFSHTVHRKLEGAESMPRG
jgi:hypothetical protein